MDSIHVTSITHAIATMLLARTSVAVRALIRNQNLIRAIERTSAGPTASAVMIRVTSSPAT